MQNRLTQKLNSLSSDQILENSTLAKAKSSIIDQSAIHNISKSNLNSQESHPHHEPQAPAVMNAELCNQKTTTSTIGTQTVVNTDTMAISTDDARCSMKDACC